MNRLAQAYHERRQANDFCAASDLAYWLITSDPQRHIYWAIESVDALIRRQDYAGAAGHGLNLVRRHPELSRDVIFRMKLLNAVDVGSVLTGNQHDTQLLKMALGMDRESEQRTRLLSMEAFVEDFPQYEYSGFVLERLVALTDMLIERDLRISQGLRPFGKILFLNTVYQYRRILQSRYAGHVIFNVGMAQVDLAKEILAPDGILNFSYWTEAQVASAFGIERDQPVDRLAIARFLLHQARQNVEHLRRFEGQDKLISNLSAAIERF